MPLKRSKIFVLVLLLVLFASSPAPGFDMETRYVAVVYESTGALRKFNKKLNMGSLNYLLDGKNNETTEDEVRNKIDVIVEKVETVLDMYPDDMKFKIVIYESAEGVRKEYKRIYGQDVDYIAFYSPTEDAVFLSAKNTTLRVVSHEIGHVVAEKYFDISPPVKIHEMIAQYAEGHITD